MSNFILHIVRILVNLLYANMQIRHLKLILLLLTRSKSHSTHGTGWDRLLCILHYTSEEYVLFPIKTYFFFYTFCLKIISLVLFFSLFLLYQVKNQG